jgi:hypothetical protein
MASTGTKVCDVCNTALGPTDGYLVSNQAVVVSEAYWVRAFEAGRGLIDIFGVNDRKQLTRMFSERLQIRAQDRTPWLICDGCTELVLADWVEARSHLLRGTEPESASVEAAAFVLPAARAWERVYGWWPKKAVKPVRAVGECDLCRKRIAETEQVAFLKTELVADWRRDGVLETDPVRPPRSPAPNPEATGWLACEPCQARLFARLYRLRPIQD